jgi:serine-type D-Ala-D-Ala carboxypeptidase (penicillin-binding protein 5/6)
MRIHWKMIAIFGFLLILILIGSGTALAGESTLKLDSHSAILIEPVSGEVLYQQNPDQKMPPASVTKLMVMLLALEAIDKQRVKLADVVSASPEACKMGGSQIWLEPGEQMTVAELLKAICIVSANDASYALAEHLAGSEENFVAAMNKRAKELGLKNTSYVNTSGLEPGTGGEGNITSAADMAILAREVIKYPLVFQWTGIWIDSLRGGKSFLRNTNNLVRFYRGCDGLKTGFTNAAGFCLAASAKREGVRLIAVVMKSPTSQTRSKDIAKLFNYGFSQFKAHSIFKGGEKVGSIKVFRGRQPSVTAVVPRELTAILKRNQTGTIKKTIRLDPVVNAPVQPGQKIGVVLLEIDGKSCGQMELVADREVKRASLLELWRQILGGIFGITVH